MEKKKNKWNSIWLDHAQIAPLAIRNYIVSHSQTLSHVSRTPTKIFIYLAKKKFFHMTTPYLMKKNLLFLIFHTEFSCIGN